MLLKALVLASALFSDGFESPADSCFTDTQDPLNLPLDFQGYYDTMPGRRKLYWETAFNGYSYPLSGGPLASVGSWTLEEGGFGNVPVSGRYLSIGFVADGSHHKIEWGLAQTTVFYPYARRGDPYITLSPCYGDFRLPVEGVPLDPFLRAACRKGPIVQNSLFYGATGSNTCWVTPGEKYYINIVFEDPYDGLDPSTTTCGNGFNDKCETNMKHN